MERRGPDALRGAAVRLALFSMRKLAIDLSPESRLIYSRFGEIIALKKIYGRAIYNGQEKY